MVPGLFSGPVAAVRGLAKALPRLLLTRRRCRFWSRDVFGFGAVPLRVAVLMDPLWWSRLASFFAFLAWL